MKMESMKVLNMAMVTGETVWARVKTWDSFARDTIGKQFVRSIDSVAANIA